MTSFRRTRDFIRDDDGPTAAEYSVMLALIVGAIILAVNAIGNTASGVWATDINRINSASGGS